MAGLGEKDSRGGSGVDEEVDPEWTRCSKIKFGKEEIIDLLPRGSPPDGPLLEKRSHISNSVQISINDRISRPKRARVCVCELSPREWGESLLSICVSREVLIFHSTVLPNDEKCFSRRMTTKIIFIRGFSPCAFWGIWKIHTRLLVDENSPNLASLVFDCHPKVKLPRNEIPLGPKNCQYFPHPVFAFSHNFFYLRKHVKRWKENIFKRVNILIRFLFTLSRRQIPSESLHFLESLRSVFMIWPS